MRYQIALDPALNVSPTAFVEAWNGDPDRRALAEARLAPAPSQGYDPFLTGVIAVLGTIAVGVVTNALYDMLKHTVTQALAGNDPAFSINRVEIRTIEHPDGTRLLVITLASDAQEDNQ